MHGIYQIRNTTNNKIYIGSARNIRQRWWRHRWDLGRGRHRNNHLQRAWDRDGKDVFVFEVLEEVEDPTQLLPREQAWLDSTDFDILYNITLTAGSLLGYVPTLATREKLRKAAMGVVFTAARRKAISVSRKGAHVSMETREKIRQTMQGRFVSDETREKHRQAALGKITRHTLTWALVRRIRYLRQQQHWTVPQLSDKFGVKRQQIYRILQNLAWVTENKCVVVRAKKKVCK
jgi:group I intron endonuclease